MQPDHGWRLALVEMTKHGFAHVCAQPFPLVRFGDDGMPKRSCDETAIDLVLRHLENDLGCHRVTMLEPVNRVKALIYFPTKIRRKSPSENFAFNPWRTMIRSSDGITNSR